MSVTPINSKLFKAVAADTAAIAALQTLGGAGNMTLTGSTINDRFQYGYNCYSCIYR